MQKAKQETPILEGMDAYSPPIHLCIDKRFQRQLGDQVVMYGPEPVIERNGRIVAVLGDNGFEKPAMICHVRDVCAGG